MRVFRIFPFCIAILLMIVGSCKKDFIVIEDDHDDDPTLPALDPDAKLQLKSPSDSAYFARNGEIELSASVTGSQTDYSFLELSVIETNTGDTLQRGAINADGSIHLSWQNALAPGEYELSAVAVNTADPNDTLMSDTRHIFICIPPPVSITGLTKDATSITISWEKTVAVDNFKAYEILSVRTDTASAPPPYPPGKVIAVITDINTTSFTDKTIYFYYEYGYRVRVVTREDCASASEGKTLVAGKFIDLPAHTQTADMIFDRNRSKMYALDNQHAAGPRLTVYNAEIPSVERSITVDKDIVFMGMNETGSALNLVKKINVNMFQLQSVDLNSFTIANEEIFIPPALAATIEGVFEKRVLYSSIAVIGPAKSLLSLYDIVTGDHEIIGQVDIRRVTAIDNNSKFVINSTDNYFSVYSLEGGDIQLIARQYVPSLAHSQVQAVFSSGGKIAVGGNLYDEYFNLLHSLGNNEYFTGLSADGTHAATSKNEVYNIASSNPQLVKKYGDGFGTYPWFSNDNKTLYHLTEGSANPKWNPGPRLFRYPLLN
ncbi:MAG TPA: hypothetical protein PK339_15245 [Flavitalea sp.]|nr:hypothetical protein [Flavitalea sp.]